MHPIHPTRLIPNRPRLSSTGTAFTRDYPCAPHRPPHLRCLVSTDLGPGIPRHPPFPVPRSHRPSRIALPRRRCPGRTRSTRSRCQTRASSSSTVPSTVVPLWSLWTAARRPTTSRPPLLPRTTFPWWQEIRSAPSLWPMVEASQQRGCYRPSSVLSRTPTDWI